MRRGKPIKVGGCLVQIRTSIALKDYVDPKFEPSEHRDTTKVSIVIRFRLKADEARGTVSFY